MIENDTDERSRRQQVSAPLFVHKSVSRQYRFTNSASISVSIPSMGAAALMARAVNRLSFWREREVNPLTVQQAGWVLSPSQDVPQGVKPSLDTSFKKAFRSSMVRKLRVSITRRIVSVSPPRLRMASM